MTTNEQQKEAIKLIRTELSYWENTNDISSPSHHSSIENMHGILDNAAYEGIQEGLTLVLFHIRKLTP